MSTRTSMLNNGTLTTEELAVLGRRSGKVDSGSEASPAKFPSNDWLGEMPVDDKGDIKLRSEAW